MKFFIIILSFIFVLPALADEAYIGGTYGYSNLNYDLEAAAGNSVSTNKTAAKINGIIQALNGDVNVKADKNSPFVKIFIGYKFGQYWGVEFFNVKINGYSLNADANVSIGSSYNAESKLGSSYAVANANLNAKGKATADFNGFGSRVNGFIPITKNLNLLMGIGAMKAKVDVKVSYDVNADWGYAAGVDINSQSLNNGQIISPNYSTNANGNYTYGYNETKLYDFSGFVPVFSLGFIYKITNHLGIRSEVELFGVPIDGLSITTASIGAQYIF